jgi:hypothetical protein
MTDRQEIRVKSAELAIRLIGVAVKEVEASTKPSLLPKFLNAEEAQPYFDSVVNLGKQFESFILDAPGT